MRVRKGLNGEESLFDSEQSDFIRDMFSDVKLEYSWKTDDGENMEPFDMNCNTPRSPIDGDACGCGGECGGKTCGDACKCNGKNTRKISPDFYDRMKKDSTELLLKKLQSNKYTNSQKAIILTVLELRGVKVSIN